MPTKIPKPRSKLETKFLFLWDKVIKGPKLEEEVVFIPGRRFRCDFKLGNILIEIEGGHWMNRSRHTSGAGFEGDCEKYFLAFLADFRVVRLTSNMITEENLRRILAFYKS
jgi:hypothetical protein